MKKFVAMFFSLGMLLGLMGGVAHANDTNNDPAPATSTVVGSGPVVGAESFNFGGVTVTIYFNVRHEVVTDGQAIAAWQSVSPRMIPGGNDSQDIGPTSATNACLDPDQDNDCSGVNDTE